jgi:hypothetical protein
MQKTNGPRSKGKIKAQLRPPLWIAALRWWLRIWRFGVQSAHNLIFMPIVSILDYRCYAVLSMMIISVYSSRLMVFPERPNRRSASFHRSLRPAFREWRFEPPKTRHTRWVRSLLRSRSCDPCWDAGSWFLRILKRHRRHRLPASLRAGCWRWWSTPPPLNTLSLTLGWKLRFFVCGATLSHKLL